MPSSQKKQPLNNINTKYVAPEEKKFLSNIQGKNIGFFNQNKKVTLDPKKSDINLKEYKDLFKRSTRGKFIPERAFFYSSKIQNKNEISPIKLHVSVNLEQGLYKAFLCMQKLLQMYPKVINVFKVINTRYSEERIAELEEDLDFMIDCSELENPNIEALYLTGELKRKYPNMHRLYETIQYFKRTIYQAPITIYFNKSENIEAFKGDVLDVTLSLNKMLTEADIAPSVRRTFTTDTIVDNWSSITIDTLDGVYLSSFSEQGCNRRRELMDESHVISFITTQLRHELESSEQMKTYSC